MKLISLELTNYRRFKTALIEFREGVVGVLGLNGAVSWVMYGNESKIVRTRKEDLKRFGAAPNDVCEVNLAFELDGDKYTVTRKMKGKNFQTTANVTINGTSAATSTKSVTALIEDRLGMDYQAFYTSVFAKQRELNALSGLDPSKRKKLILRMLNIDSIDKAIISVRSDRREFDTRLDETRSGLIEPDGTPKLETIKIQIAKHKEKTQEISQSIIDMKKHKEEMMEDIKSLESTRTNQRKLRDEYNKLNTKLTKCKTNMENTAHQQSKVDHSLKELIKHEDALKELEPKAAEWKKVKTKKAELDEIQNKFIRSEELQKQLKSVNEQINRYNAQIKKAEDELKKFVGLDKDSDDCQLALSKINEEIDEHKKARSELGSKLDQLGTEIEKIENKLKDIKNLGPESACPTCERLLGEHYKTLEDKFGKEHNEMKSTLEKLKKSIEETKSKLEDDEKRKEALRKREKYLNSEISLRARTQETSKTSQCELEQTRARRQKLTSELEQYKDLKFDIDEYTTLKSNYLGLEKVNEKFISLKERIEQKPKLVSEQKLLKESLNNLTAERTKVELKIQKLGFDEKQLEQLEVKYEEGSQKLKNHEMKVKEKENELNLHQKDISQLTAKIDELKELGNKAKEYKDKLMYLNKLDKIMNKFKNYMISRIAPTLTQFASELFRVLTDGKYNRLEVDNDYNVLIYDNGEAFPLSRFSGGEEDLANLCLRLAISQVITAQSGTTGPSFVILDEIFGSQDLYRKRNLLHALSGLTNKFRQIFLITHIEDVKDFIGFNIQVTENDDGTSSVRTIS